MFASLFGRRAAHNIDVLRASHAPECARLHAVYFAHPWSVAEFEALIAGASGDGAAALDGKGRVLGFILVRQAADEAEILTIAVDKSVQKQGIGKELLDAASDRLRIAGVRKLFLEVDEENQAARRLYAKAGFAQVGQRQGYYRSAGGKPANALILASEMH